MPTRALLLLMLVAACAEEGPPRPKEIEMDAATFRSMLQCAAPEVRAKPQCDRLTEMLQAIESVRIEPTGDASARYVITWRSDAIRRVVHAEFPGKIIDELTAAQITYSVKPR